MRIRRHSVAEPKRPVTIPCRRGPCSERNVPERQCEGEIAIVKTALRGVVDAVILRPDDQAGKPTEADFRVAGLSAGGAVSLFASSATNVLVDVAGWFTDTSASSSTVGLLQTIRPTRVLDTRDTKTRWAAGETRLAPIATSAKPAGTFVYNLTATNTGGWGFLTAFSPDKSLPIASNVNFEQAGQSRAALAISQGKALAAGGAPLANIYSYAATDIIVDATAYFTS